MILFIFSIFIVNSITNVASVPIHDSDILNHKFANASNIGPVTERCLRCMCEMLSGCKYMDYNGYTSGSFRIMRDYWKDAGEPQVNPPNQDGSKSDYVACTTNYECAVRTIQKYMKKFQKDCNSDGVINCNDFGAIHIFGPYSCHKKLPDSHNTKYLECEDLSKHPKV